MTDVLKDLLRVSWRGIEFPITARQFGFQHEQARHRYIFRDEKLVEALGRDNPSYRYTIPFREDIAKGPYANLFVSVYPEFLGACVDRSRGVLEDCVHGSRQVQCVSLAENLDVNRRDGIDVDVEFIVSPDEADLGQSFADQLATVDGAKGVAGAFDRQAEIVDWQQEESPQSLVNPLDALSGIADQLNVASNKVTNAVADLNFRAQKAIDSIDRLKQPKLAPLRTQARRSQAIANKLPETLELRGNRPIRVHVTDRETTVGQLASRLSNTVRQIIELNGRLARSPLVQQGERVRYLGPEDTSKIDQPFR